MRPADLDTAFVVGICTYELGGLAGWWKPWTHIFREHPWTFVGFVGWLFWHTWLKPGSPWRTP